METTSHPDASATGFCHAPANVEVATVCRHTGEEPPLCGEKGICNVFFAHCNLHCLYCQNNEISGRLVDDSLIRFRSVDELVGQIALVLPSCENLVGFVSPTHYAYAIPLIVQALHSRGLHPTIVYNTNAYETIDTLRLVEPYVDIYLPDMKYMDGQLAHRYSQAADYPAVATAAIKEMIRQKGGGLLCDNRGIAFRGVVVRHLVLPGQVANSKRVVQWVADELPWNVHLSVMAQYYPNNNCLVDSLNRTLSPDEYAQVANVVNEVGLVNVWLQEISSNENYRPDFAKSHPFQTLS